MCFDCPQTLAWGRVGVLLCHPHCFFHRHWGGPALPPPWCQAVHKSLHLLWELPSVNAPGYSSSSPRSEPHLNVNASKMKPG